MLTAHLHTMCILSPTLCKHRPHYQVEAPVLSPAGGCDLVLEVVVADPRAPLLLAVCRLSWMRLAGSGVCGFWLSIHP